MSLVQNKASIEECGAQCSVAPDGPQSGTNSYRLPSDKLCPNRIEQGHPPRKKCIRCVG